MEFTCQPRRGSWHAGRFPGARRNASRRALRHAV